MPVDTPAAARSTGSVLAPALPLNVRGRTITTAKIAYLLGERRGWKNWSLVGVMNRDGTGKASSRDRSR